MYKCDWFSGRGYGVWWLGVWGGGLGVWGLGFGDWGLGIGPNPQSPIPNPQSPIPIFFLNSFNKIYKIK